MTARPRLELAIGITGHRQVNLHGADQVALKAAVATALTQLVAALQAVQQRYPEAFDAAPARFRLVSALADGADSLVAHAALAAGWRLDACLPFARDDYAADFDAPQRADPGACDRRAREPASNASRDERGGSRSLLRFMSRYRVAGRWDFGLAEAV